MDLKNVDLNLLVVFNDLLNTGRVGQTAERLGMTQPAVSNCLARLRRLLGDDLFIRTQQGMVPTPYAEALAEPVSYALGAIHSALNQSVVFDPARSRQNFVIAMTDIGEIHFLPALMARLAAVAPGVSVSTVRNLSIDLPREMEAGNVHLAIGLLPDLQTGFFQRRLFGQHYVCLYRHGHPLDRPGGMTLEDFTAAEHVGVVAAGTGHGIVDDLLARMGVARRLRLQVPHFVAVGHILRNTDMVATVPQVLAQCIAGPFGLSWCAHPVSLPEVSIGLFWHSKFHRDAANQWLRAQIVAIRPEGVDEGRTEDGATAL